MPGGRHRLCPGAGDPGDVHRRTGLRALHASGICRPSVREPLGGRPGPRHPQRRIPGDRLAPAGEGVLLLGAEVSPDYNPYDAWIGFTVHLDKGPFKGREALFEDQTGGPKWKLCTFTLDHERPILLSGGRRSPAGARSSGRSPAAAMAIRWGRQSLWAICLPKMRMIRAALPLRCIGRRSRPHGFRSPHMMRTAAGFSFRRSSQAKF